MSTTSTGSRLYESSKAVDEYIQMHYASQQALFPYEDQYAPSAGFNFVSRTAALCGECFDKHGKKEEETKALDVGCAVGGSSFELAKKFGKVDGFDFSKAFVATAQKMQQEKKLTYSSLQFGESFEDRVVSLPDSLDTSNINFFWGDACSLSTNENVGKGYDIVHASNLLCRLPKPKQFLKDCGDFLVKEGGLLVLVSPYSWLEDYTAKEDWVMGPDGPFEALKAELSEKFELVERKPFPFIIREHARKFQYGVSDGTVWRKK